MLHQLHGFHRQRVFGDGSRVGVHHLLRCGAAQINAFFNQAAQIAIGEDAQHAGVGIHDGGGAQAFGAHFAHQLAEACTRQHLRHAAAGAHHVTHVGEQFAAQRTAGVGAGKVFGLETARVQQGDGQRIAQRQLRRGAGGGGQVERAGFLVDAAVQNDVGVFRQGRFNVAGHRNQRHAQAFEHGQDRHQLFGLAAVGDGQHQVDWLDHAQVAMAGLGRVDKQGRRAGGRQRGGGFAPDVAAFAHAHDHHAAAHAEHHPYRLRELGTHALFEPQHGGGFDVEGLICELDGPLRGATGALWFCVRVGDVCFLCGHCPNIL